MIRTFLQRIIIFKTYVRINVIRTKFLFLEILLLQTFYLYFTFTFTIFQNRISQGPKLKARITMRNVFSLYNMYHKRKLILCYVSFVNFLFFTLILFTSILRLNKLYYLERNLLRCIYFSNVVIYSISLFAYISRAMTLSRVEI